VPAENNGYFDPKVLSRQDAEVWEEYAKFCLIQLGMSFFKIFVLFFWLDLHQGVKDVQSLNGTLINGEQLSLEDLESEPYELKSDDIVNCLF
jgi:pSer/pThr/pTyr-binding forkhead associated (FHA) protein